MRVVTTPHMSDIFHLAGLLSDGPAKYSNQLESISNSLFKSQLCILYNLRFKEKLQR